MRVAHQASRLDGSNLFSVSIDVQQNVAWQHSGFELSGKQQQWINNSVQEFGSGEEMVSFAL